MKILSSDVISQVKDLNTQLGSGPISKSAGEVEDLKERVNKTAFLAQYLTGEEQEEIADLVENNMQLIKTLESND